MAGMQSELSAERRAGSLAKGRSLYGKCRGGSGRGTCAESFARYQLRLGNVEVVRDLLEFLNGQLATLRAHDPEELLPMTESLAGEIRQHLEKNEVRSSHPLQNPRDSLDRGPRRV